MPKPCGPEKVAVLWHYPPAGMSFVSIDYGILLAACLFAYHFLGRREQNVLLLVTSYVFYGAWDWRFLFLLGGSTVWDYFVGGKLYTAVRSGDAVRKRRWLLASLCVNLSVLGFFKYFGFFADSAQVVLQKLGVHADLPTLHVILPVGISFYTFQSLSYSIDIYRGEMQPARSLLDFAAFIAFFPQLVAGPIERAKHMLPQFGSPRSVSETQIHEGIWLILFGYVRKVVVADTAAHFANPMFDAPAKCTSLELMCGLLLFSLQIYGDFAGYSDIARGTAKLFGFELMRNFDHPYFSRNVTEFWRRWHISLSTWLRDYLYIPLGGNRGGELRTYRNLMATMLLGGLWHGASWNFVIWGGLHGLYLCVHRALRGPLANPPRAITALPAGLRSLLGGAITLGLVAFAWLFFRSTSTELTGQYVAGLLRFDMGGGAEIVPVIVLGSLMLALDLPQALTGDDLAIARLPRIARLPIATAMIVLFAFSLEAGQPFIYFQF
jgi:alginate O-acetyltransferase complex protein AlgI